MRGGGPRGPGAADCELRGGAAGRQEGEQAARGAAGRGERLQSRLAGRGEDRRLPRGQVACAQGGELRRRAGGPHGERRQQRQERGRGGAQADRRGVRPLEEARRTAAAAKVRVGGSNVRGAARGVECADAGLRARARVREARAAKRGGGPLERVRCGLRGRKRVGRGPYRASDVRGLARAAVPRLPERRR